MSRMLKNRKILFTIFSLSLLSFIILCFFVMANPIPKLDHQISLLLQAYHADWLDKVMLFISSFGELPTSLLMVLIVAIIFFRYRLRRESYYILAILSSGLLILAIKNIINRPRPTQFYVRLVEINRFQSFPSGHVLSYVLFFGFMIVLVRTAKKIPNRTRKFVTSISLFFGLTIPISRIYLGAHWFTDTLGGFLLGISCLVALSYFYVKGTEGFK